MFHRGSSTYCFFFALLLMGTPLFLPFQVSPGALQSCPRQPWGLWSCPWHSQRRTQAGRPPVTPPPGSPSSKQPRASQKWPGILVSGGGCRERWDPRVPRQGIWLGDPSRHQPYPPPPGGPREDIRSITKQKEEPTGPAAHPKSLQFVGVNGG